VREFENGYWVDETDFRFTFTILGRPAVLKNSKQLVTVRGKPRLIPNAHAGKWAKRAIKDVAAQWPFGEPIPDRVEIEASIVTYAHDKRKRDLDNSLSGPLDILMPPKTGAAGKVKQPGAGILTDDSQVKSLDGSRLRYDKDNPRVEITIRPYLEQACPWCGDTHLGGPELCKT